MLAPIAMILSALVASSLACQPSGDFKMTFYGWADNDPPSAKVAMNCGGRNGIAGGDGSYTNPLTFAAEKGRFADCEIVYSPYLKKYLRSEDTCADCTGDWVDIWTGSNTENGGSALVDCENTLTGSFKSNQVIITTPPSTLDVSNAELFEAGRCCTENVFTANAANLSCDPGSTSGPALTSALPVPTGAVSPPTTTFVTVPSAKPSGKHRTRKGKPQHQRM